MKLGLECRRTELQIATQCAPLLAGLKPSNLLILPESESRDLGKVLYSAGLSYDKLAGKDKREVYLVYRPEELEDYLAETEVRELLAELGYAKPELSGLLEAIGKKYGRHQNLGTEFPHELGLVLGYPAVDVRGFMQNDGKNFLHSGYWKVYGNLSMTRRLFEEFQRAKEIAVELARTGYSISDIAAYYISREKLRPAI